MKCEENTRHEYPDINVSRINFYDLLLNQNLKANLIQNVPDAHVNVQNQMFNHDPNAPHEQSMETPPRPLNNSTLDADNSLNHSSEGRSDMSETREYHDTASNNSLTDEDDDVHDRTLNVEPELLRRSSRTKTIVSKLNISSTKTKNYVKETGVVSQNNQG